MANVEKISIALPADMATLVRKAWQPVTTPPAAK